MAMTTVTVLRIGADGTVSRQSLGFDDRGSCGASLRELIGCRFFEVIEIDEGLDVWVDEEALLGVDLADPRAVAAAVNQVGSWVVRHRAGQELQSPLLGPVVFAGRHGCETTGLGEAELRRVERLAAAASVALMVAHAGGAR
jgi:hypothetical protein